MLTEFGSVWLCASGLKRKNGLSTVKRMRFVVPWAAGGPAPGTHIMRGRMCSEDITKEKHIIGMVNGPWGLVRFTIISRLPF